MWLKFRRLVLLSSREWLAFSQVSVGVSWKQILVWVAAVTAEVTKTATAAAIAFMFWFTFLFHILNIKIIHEYFMFPVTFPIHVHDHVLTSAHCHYVHQGIKVLTPSPSWHAWLGKPLTSPARRAESCPCNKEHSDLLINHCNLHPLVLLYLLSNIIYTYTLTSAITLFCHCKKEKCRLTRSPCKIVIFVDTIQEYVDRAT